LRTAAIFALVLCCAVVKSQQRADVDLREVLARFDQGSVAELVDQLGRCGGLHQALADSWTVRNDDVFAERARGAARAAESAATFVLGVQAFEAGVPKPYVEFRPRVQSSVERTRSEIQAMIDTNDEPGGGRLYLAILRRDAINPPNPTRNKMLTDAR